MDDQRLLDPDGDVSLITEILEEGVLLSLGEARKEGVAEMTADQKRGIHVEFTTDDLDARYEVLSAKAWCFTNRPTMSRGSGS